MWRCHPKLLTSLLLLHFGLIIVTATNAQIISSGSHNEPVQLFEYLASTTSQSARLWQNPAKSDGDTLPSSHQWFVMAIPEYCRKKECVLHFSRAPPGAAECVTSDDTQKNCQQISVDFLPPVFKNVAPGAVLHLYPNPNDPDAIHQYIILSSSHHRPEISPASIRDFPAPSLFVESDDNTYRPDRIIPVIPAVHCHQNQVQFNYYPLQAELTGPAYLLALIHGYLPEKPPELIVSLDNSSCEFEQATDYFSDLRYKPDFIRTIHDHLQAFHETENILNFKGILAYREYFNPSTAQVEFQVYADGQWQDATASMYRWVRGLQHIEELDRIFGIDTFGPYGFNTPGNSAYRALMDRLIAEERQETNAGLVKRPAKKGMNKNSPLNGRYTVRKAGGGTGEKKRAPAAGNRKPGAAGETASSSPAAIATSSGGTVKGAKQWPSEQSSKADKKKVAPDPSGSLQTLNTVCIRGVWFQAETKLETNHFCRACDLILDETTVQTNREFSIFKEAERIHEVCAGGGNSEFYREDNAYRRDLCNTLLTCLGCKLFKHQPYIKKDKHTKVYFNYAVDHAKRHADEIVCHVCGFVSYAKQLEQQKAELENHQPGLCLVSCRWCGVKYRRNDESIHSGKCSERIVQCTLAGCNDKMAAKDYHAHLCKTHFSYNHTLTCALCHKHSFDIAFLIPHAIKCDQSGVYPCNMPPPEECNIHFYDYKSLIQHACAKHSEKYFAAIRMFQTEQSSPDSAMMPLINAFKENSQQEKDKTSLSHYEKVIQSQSQEIRSLKELLEKVQGQLTAQSRQPAGTSRALVRADNDFSTDDRTSLLQKLSESVEQLQRIVAEQNNVIDGCKLAMDVLDVKTTNGIFIWKIPDLRRRYFSARREQRTISLYSPPFYTSPCGYKMCIRIYPNGDGIGKGTHVSVFFVVMRSEYDNLLSWPFKQTVRFTLINQKNPGASITEAFVPDQKSPSFQKPESNTDMNTASGFPKFTRQATLNDENYTQDDMIFIKCQVNVAGLSGN